MSLVDLVSRGLLAENRPLAPLTTYKFGGPARWFAKVNSEAMLQEVLEARASEPEAMQLLVVGRGSNLVIADSGFDGLVIQLSGGFIATHTKEDGSVVAGAALALPVLARSTVRDGRGGLEFFVGVPGSVGGAVRMNAGCHGSEARDWLISAAIIDAATGERTTRDPEGLELSYRHSNLTEDDIVVNAVFRTVSRPREKGEEIIREITRWRKENQPGGTFNAGSVFKNPDTAPAGKIIDELGLKGFRRGGASVSERHANFFVADDSASAQDVFDLVFEVQRRVVDETGILLEPEIRFAGDFDSGNGERT